MIEKLSARDRLTFKKLGLERYADGMSITYPLPDLPPLPPTLSKSARQRLRWFDYYRHRGNVSLTCRHFGIARKTFYHWQKRYQPTNLTSLEERTRRPRRVRQWQVSRQEELNILSLRHQYLRYGKLKLQVIYRRHYGQTISSWKIQRVIERHQLYYHPIKTNQRQLARKRSQPKHRITALKREQRTGFLIALDTIVLYTYGQKRYLLTGIDTHGKIAFARMYPGHGSYYAADFLKRMHYLLDGQIENIQTDNGSEFAKYFSLAAQQLKLTHYHSRIKTPKDNAFDERFNRTLKEEFIALGHLTSDCAIFNQNLTEWLIEYNYYRPHQSLGYQTPIEFHNQYQKVLPMYPSSTSTFSHCFLKL